MLATSDLPGGVVNILTGHRAELAPWLASHMDVNGLDLTGPPDDLARECEEAAAENLKRVLRPARIDRSGWTASRHRSDDHVPGNKDRLASGRRVDLRQLWNRSTRN